MLEYIKKNSNSVNLVRIPSIQYKSNFPKNTDYTKSSKKNTLKMSYDIMSYDIYFQTVRPKQTNSTLKIMSECILSITET